MKILRAIFGIGVSTVALSVSAADVVTLKLSHHNPSVSPIQQQVFQPWCDKIEKDSGGRLKCQIYPAMQLGGTPAQLVDQVKNGVADIAWVIPGYSTGRFPTIEALELPFMISGGETGNRSAWEYYQKYAQKDFEGYKVLAVHMDAGAAIHTGSRMVRGIADIKGLKLRASNRMMSKTLVALGAMPVNMPPPQVAEAIAKGVVDGALLSWEAVMPFKLNEVTKFHTNPPAGQPMFSGTVLAMLMNKQKYESLPADLRSVIDRNSGASLGDSFGKLWDESAAAAHKAVVEQGATVFTLSASDYEAMRSAALIVESEWVKDVSAKGLDGRQLAAAAREAATKYGRK